jgi:hypothetical protein
MDHAFKHLEARQLNRNAHGYGIGDWIAGRDDAVRRRRLESRRMSHKSKPYTCLTDISGWNSPADSENRRMCHPSVVI